MPQNSSSEAITLFADKTPRVCVILSEDHNGAHQGAAIELERYLHAMTGSRFPSSIGATMGELLPIAVGPGELCSQILQSASLTLKGRGEEAFAIAVGREGIALVGNRGRSTFYAVYAFLELLGCRFLEPGKDGEYVPQKQEIEVSWCRTVSEPRLPYRTIHLDCSRWAGMYHAVDVIEWTLKNRGNMVEIVPFHMDEQRLIEHFPLILEEIKQRDLLASFGGHGAGMFFMLPDDCLYPGRKPKDRADFYRRLNQTRSAEPDLFGGESHPLSTTNGAPMFCVSNPRAVERFVNNVMAFLESYPEVDAIRLGQNDLGIPCRCPQCIATFADNYYHDLLPKVGAAMRQRFPQKRFIHMLQGQGNAPAVEGLTDEISDKVMFCKGNEGFDCRGDITEAYNRVDYDLLQGHLVAVGSHPFITKELYGSGLYRFVPFWCPKIVWRNTRYYVENLTNYEGSHVFTFSSHYWRLWSPNLYVFLRVLWDPDLDIDALIADYIEHAYPGIPAIGQRIFRLFEEYGTRLAVFFRACKYAIGKQARLSCEQAKSEAKIRDPNVDWTAMLSVAIDEAEELLHEMDRELSMHADDFIGHWLKRDRICLEYLLAYSCYRLEEFQSLGLDNRDQARWDPDWTEKLTADTELLSEWRQRLEQLLP